MNIWRTNHLRYRLLPNISLFFRPISLHNHNCTIVLILVYWPNRKTPVSIVRNNANLLFWIIHFYYPDFDLFSFARVDELLLFVYDDYHHRWSALRHPDGCSDTCTAKVMNRGLDFEFLLTSPNKVLLNRIVDADLVRVGPFGRFRVVGLFDLIYWPRPLHGRLLADVVASGYSVW